jgi:hypothetical protein
LEVEIRLACREQDKKSAVVRADLQECHSGLPHRRVVGCSLLRLPTTMLYTHVNVTLLGLFLHSLRVTRTRSEYHRKSWTLLWQWRNHVHDIDKQTFCDLPHISIMHTNRLRSTQTTHLSHDTRRMPKGVPPVDRHGGSSAAWNSLDYHQLIS